LKTGGSGGVPAREIGCNVLEEQIRCHIFDSTQFRICDILRGSGCKGRLLAIVEYIRKMRIEDNPYLIQLGFN
jgi:hypothetical protein